MSTATLAVHTVKSKDGTRIAYDALGSGPVVVLVGGALNHRGFGPNVGLAPLLAPHFTVISYDRRGRGDSGGESARSIARECEDLDAVIRQCGQPAAVYGISSGGALVLEAAKRGVSIDKLAVFEVPFVVDSTSRPPIPRDWIAQMEQLVAENRRGDAVAYFMTKGVNLPSALVVLMRLMPAWKKLKALAHTIPDDARLLGNHAFGAPLAKSEWEGLVMPKLVIDGGKSPAWTRTAMVELAQALDAEHTTLPGQMHIVKPAAIAPPLIEFFSRPPKSSDHSVVTT